MLSASNCLFGFFSCTCRRTFDNWQIDSKGCALVLQVFHDYCTFVAGNYAMKDSKAYPIFFTLFYVILRFECF